MWYVLEDLFEAVGGVVVIVWCRLVHL
jgi:hypothetical protein